MWLNEEINSQTYTLGEAVQIKLRVHKERGYRKYGRNGRIFKVALLFLKHVRSHLVVIYSKRIADLARIPFLVLVIGFSLL